MNILLKYIIYTLVYVPVEVVYILLLCNFILYKIIVFVINTYYYYAQAEKRKNGIPYSEVISYQDNLFYIIETDTNPSYNTLVLKLSNRIDRKDFVRNLSEKIFTVDENNEAIFSKLRQVASKGYLFSTWEECREFNIEEHISEHELDFSQEGNLERFICEMDNDEVDLKIPQWNICLMTDPKEDNSSYLVWRVHHALGDAMSLWNVLFKLCDINHKDIGADKLTATRLSPFQRNMAYVKAFLYIPMYLTDLLVLIATHSRKYTDGLTTVKRAAMSNQIDFQKIREIKSKTKTTVNDVILTLVTESTRRYFSRRDRNDLIEKEIAYGMAVALSFNFDNYILTNNDAGVLVLTPTNQEGIFNQLKIVNRNMTKLKRESWVFFYKMTLDFLITLPIPVSLIRKITGSVSMGIGNFSNVLGPNFTLTVNSAIIEEAYCLVMTSWDQVLGIVFSTYKGRMHVGVKTDACIVDNPKELVDEFTRVLEEMYVQVNSNSNTII